MNALLFLEGNCESDCTNGKECLPLETKYFCHCPNGKTGENCGKNGMYMYVMILIFIVDKFFWVSSHVKLPAGMQR